MAAQVLTDLTDALNKAKTAMDAATTLINGIPLKIQTAIDTAIAGGATAAELTPFTDLITSLNASSTALAAATTANP